MTDDVCQETQKLLASIPEDGELSATQKEAIERHITTCDKCRLESQLTNLMNIDERPGPPRFLADPLAREQWIADTLNAAEVDIDSSEEPLLHIVPPPARSKGPGLTRVGIGLGVAAGLAIVVTALFWPTQPPDHEDPQLGPAKWAAPAEKKPEIHRELGTLTVHAPFTDIYINDVFIKDSRIDDYSLAPGEYKVTAKHLLFDLKRIYFVHIKPGRDTILQIDTGIGEEQIKRNIAASPPERTDQQAKRPNPDQEYGTLTINSDVGVGVFIDGEFIQGTPLVRYVLAPGRYTVSLEYREDDHFENSRSFEHRERKGLEKLESFTIRSSYKVTIRPGKETVLGRSDF